MKKKDKGIKNLTSLASSLLPKGRFAKGVIKISLGTLLGQIVIMLFSPVLTRLYTPDDFGVLAVYTSILGMIITIGSLRYELAIPLPKNDHEAANVLVLSLLFIFGISCLSEIAVLTIGKNVVSWTNTPALLPYLWLLPLGILCGSLYTSFSYWAIRKKQYAEIGHTKLVQGIMLTLTQISLGIISMRPLGLLLGLVIGHAAGIRTLAFSAWRDRKDIFNNISTSSLFKVAFRYRRFPLVSASSSVLDSLGAQAPAILLAVFYGPAVAGCFALSQRVISAPLALLGKSVDQVYFGEASNLMITNPKGLWMFYLTTGKKLFFMGLTVVLPLVFFSPWLFKNIFGTSWLQSGLYIQVMVPTLLAQIVIKPLSNTLYIIERQHIQFVWVLVWVTSILGSIIIANFLCVSDTIAVAMLSAATTFSYALHFCLCLYVLKNEKYRAVQAK